jgi:predicted SAM-dependent methyltransferase
MAPGFGKVINKKVKLNLGCGTDIMPGFINVDIRNIHGIDMVADLLNLPLKNDSAELIFLNDVLEHFVLKTSILVLKECYRVLSDGCDLIIKVEQDKADKITPFVFQEYVYGGQDYFENLHRSGYTPQFLAGICATVGFRRVDLIEKVQNNTNIRMLVKK